jgi:N-acetylglutamate synthase-like GNAT family acetyltransferase
MALEISTCTTDGAYEAFRSVRIAVVPYERCESLEQMRADANPSRLLVLAHEDGVLVGSGIADLSDSAATGFVAPRVLPEHRRRGYGTELLRLLADHLVSLDLPRVRAAADDDESLAFARAFGFEVVDHDVEQSRTVADPPPVTELPDGVEVVLESERPGLWASCFETFGREALAGFAVSTALDISPERWATSWLGDPMYLALHDGEVVGCAGLYQDTDQPERAEHGLTAVRGDWRGRGLAAHLKLRTLHWAAEHGVREVYTWTQDGNAAMRGLNTKLGYATTRTGAQVARDLPL